MIIKTRTRKRMWEKSMWLIVYCCWPRMKCNQPLSMHKQAYTHSPSHTFTVKIHACVWTHSKQAKREVIEMGIWKWVWHFVSKSWHVSIRNEGNGCLRATFNILNENIDVAATTRKSGRDKLDATFDGGLRPIPRISWQLKSTKVLLE